MGWSGGWEGLQENGEQGFHKGLLSALEMGQKVRRDHSR